MADSSAVIKRSWLVTLLLLLFGFGIQSAWSLQSPSSFGAEGEKISFLWAFGALMGGADGARLEAVQENTVLKAGDKLKMMVELQRKCFVYVIYQNAEGDVAMLFPYSVEQFATDYEAFKRYFIPGKDAWFQLDEHLGTETFYLMASNRRLSEVEYLMSRYESADTVKKPEIAGQMIAEIKEIGKLHKELAGQSEKPVALGRVTRGVERAQGRDPTDISALAEKILFNGIYVRTITIDHK